MQSGVECAVCTVVETTPTSCVVRSLSPPSSCPVYSPGLFSLLFVVPGGDRHQLACTMGQLLATSLHANTKQHRETRRRHMEKGRTQIGRWRFFLSFLMIFSFCSFSVVVVSSCFLSPLCGRVELMRRFSSICAEPPLCVAGHIHRRTPTHMHAITRYATHAKTTHALVRPTRTALAGLASSHLQAQSRIVRGDLHSLLTRFLHLTMSSYGPMKRGTKHMTGSGSRPSPMGVAPRGGANAASRAARASSDSGAPTAASGGGNFTPFAANKNSKKTTGGEARTRAGQGFVFSKDAHATFRHASSHAHGAR